MLVFTNERIPSVRQRTDPKKQLSDRQKQILESAIKLIAEEGVVNFTTKRLAQEVSVSEPALYRHFKNKEAIILGLVIYINEKVQAIFDSYDDAVNMTALEILEVKCLLLMQFFYKNIFCAKTSSRIGMLLPNHELRREIGAMQRSIFEHEKALVERGQAEGDIRADADSRQLVQVVMGAHFFTIHTWGMSEEKYDLVAAWMKVWEVIKKMIVNENQPRARRAAPRHRVKRIAS